MNRALMMSKLLNHIASLSTVIGGVIGLGLGCYFLDQPMAGAFIGAIGAIGFWICLQVVLWWLDRRMLRQDALRKNHDFAQRLGGEESRHPFLSRPSAVMREK